MKLKALPIILICGVLSGCAAGRAQQPSPKVVALQRYAETQLPLARAGEIKWADYYSGLRDHQIEADTPYEKVHIISQLMYGAQSYENGEITKEEFQRRQHYAKTTMQDIQLRESQEMRAQQDANRALALQYLVSHPINIPPAQYAPIAPVNSQPTPSLQLPVTQFAQTSVTAIWTGKQQQVQTVTNQFGWTCEYNYLGKTFWRTFIGSCPPAVQVQ